MLFVLNFAYAIYMGSSQSFDWKLLNRLELLSEFCIQASVILMFAFTGWVESADMQTYAGYAIIGFLAIMEIAHLGYVIWFTSN